VENVHLEIKCWKNGQAEAETAGNEHMKLPTTQIPFFKSVG
jgi:hypothetical protein